MTNQWPSDTTIVIPAFRAADLLLQLLPRVRKSVPRENIVVVDDASGDSTPQLCSDLGVSCLRHHVNRGKGSALLTGFHHCITGGSRWIISMDADGQHSPDDLPKFIAASLQQPAPGICIGARSMRPGIMPFERILSNRLTSGILGILAGIP
ncbi:MAG: glycosyltransferase family 2 protein, partial [Chitinispirillaceae bacterium]|nr:glycosyltransferase family 2 protein [Chitinispirillaceae bacterium]